MPFHALDTIREEFVTPKHSTAYGRLITGEQIEVGLLRFKAGEGAKTHSHPHEQIIVMVRGRMKFTLGNEVAVIGKGDAVHIPPDLPHSAEALEEVECVSCKGMVGGVGHRI